MSQDTLFRRASEFRLIDVESVVLSNPNYLVVPEFVRFSSLELEVERDPTDRGGTNFEFGSETSNLGFDRWEQVYSTVNQIVTQKGTDAVIRIEFYLDVDNDGDLELVYTGELETSSMSQIDSIFDFLVQRVDYGGKLSTRIDQDINIEGVTDLDGNTLPNIDLLSIPMHPKTNQRESLLQGIEGVIANTRAQNVFAFEEVLLGLEEGNKNSVRQTNIYQNTVEPTNFIVTAGNPPLLDYIFGSSLGTPITIDNDLNTISVEEKGEYQIDGRAHLDVSFDATGEGGISGTVVGEYYFAIKNDETPSRNEASYIFQLRDTTTLVDDYVFNINETFTFTRLLEPGDKVYFFGGFRVSKGSGSSTDATSEVTFYRDSFTNITAKTTANNSEMKGLFIFEALDRLLKKAIGTTGVGEGLALLSGVTGTINNGDKITQSNAFGGASGEILLAPQQPLGLVAITNIVGEFRTGLIVNFSSGGQGLVDSWQSGALKSNDSPRILKSSLLEKIENEALTDGCASLQFIGNGFSVRGFINNRWESDRYYRDGDKVKYDVDGVDYQYINASVTRGNLPTDTNFWKVEDGRRITTTIEKLVDFVKLRYGAASMVMKVNNPITGNYVTRVVIEKSEDFFRDVRILTLTNVVDTPVRNFNKQILYSKIQAGYSIFAESNEEQSLLGYNTLRDYATPIKRDKNEAEYVIEACTDSAEIERLRRLTFSENPEESDDSDEETFIIDCFRVTDQNPISPALYGSDQSFLSIFFDEPNSQIQIIGLLLSEIQPGWDLITIVPPSENTYDITGVTIDRENNRTILDTSTALVAGVSFRDFYFRDSVGNVAPIFVPVRLEGLSNVSEVPEPKTEYNLTHTPTNILIENHAWYGGALSRKNGTDLIRFLSGKNNIFLEKQQAPTSCNGVTGVIKENQDFELSFIRGIRPAIFGDFSYDVTCYLSYTEFEALRLSLIGEQGVTNFGYVEFTFEGATIQGYVMNMKYNPLSTRLNLLIWERAS